MRIIFEWRGVLWFIDLINEGKFREEIRKEAQLNLREQYKSEELY